MRPSRWTAVGVAFALAAASIWHGSTASAGQPNDPEFSKQWGLVLIGAPQAWDTATGVGTVIAVADTGIDLTHNDVAPQVVAQRNFVTPGASVQDDHGHGTHVSGIAAAVTNNALGVAGTAPSARLMVLKVLDANGRGTGDLADAAIRHAAEQDADVINLSLSGTAQGITGASIGPACRYAWSLGTLCVAAAGNDYFTGSGYTADDPVLVVSAVDRYDGKPSYSSGVGAAMWGIAAPGGGDALLGGSGQGIWSTCRGSTYCYKSGTSMAAPHVAGAYAVLRSLGLTPQAAVARLLATAKDIGSPGRDSTFGSGRLDLAAAVAGLTPTTTTTTTTTTSSGGGTTTTTARGGTTTSTSTSTTTTTPQSDTTSTTNSQASTAQAKPVPRLAGRDRIETAIAISSERWPAAAANTVVLSRADSFADALAGSPVAVRRGAPLLLSGRDTLDPRTRNEIGRVTGGTGTVVLLGGQVALSANVERELTDAGYGTVRYAGADRFETAVRIARDALGDPGTLLVADGTSYRDALVAGAAAPFAGAAVVLTSGRSMPQVTRSYIVSRGGAPRYAIGGPAAVADPGATPVVGTDAPDTSRRVAERFTPNPPAVGVASRADFPDGLGGGVHAAMNGGPLVITDPRTLSPTIAEYLSSHRDRITRAYVYGGELAISEAVRTDVQRRISG
ncbi:MAG TPA: S8 family serine peptidase [Acidimicrobiales bacterium]|nr:S8 family serine peptidase [Acidimicrobiales bacterium]